MEPSRHHVKEMFDTISPTYDRLNRILSLGLDQHWRTVLARHLPQKNEPLSLLDCATGTGDQLIALLKQGLPCERACGIDIAPKMLAVARTKMARAFPTAQVAFKEASILALPFEDQTFDAVTISFGIRNVTDVPKALQEMQRVLKPNGRALILEFALPTHPLIRRFHLFYLRRILPHIGGLLSRNSSAYRYLNQTIETFPYGPQFCQLMANAGFKTCRHIPLTLGAVGLYIGET